MRHEVGIIRFKTREGLGNYDLPFLPRVGEGIIINEENLIVRQVIHDIFCSQPDVTVDVIVQNKNEYEEEFQEGLSQVIYNYFKSNLK